VWLVRSVLAFLGIGAVLVFAISNVDQKVDRIVVFTRSYENISLNLVLLWAALLGAAVCFAVMILREFALRAALRNLRRENMRLDDELVALRNLPLAGLQHPAESGRARPAGGR
jgi:uncharacterized integral membrane protein